MQSVAPVFARQVWDKICRWAPPIHEAGTCGWVCTTRPNGSGEGEAVL